MIACVTLSTLARLSTEFEGSIGSSVVTTENTSDSLLKATLCSRRNWSMLRFLSFSYAASHEACTLSSLKTFFVGSGPFASRAVTRSMYCPSSIPEDEDRVTDILRLAPLFFPTFALFFKMPHSEKSFALIIAISNATISGLSFGDGSVFTLKEIFPFLS